MKALRDLTNGLDLHQSPQHYITFGLFDSRRFRLNLHERTAPTPNEKEVLANIPYRQGVIDVSNLLGNRIYEQREITYSFYRFGVNRGHARDFQTTIENLLMGAFDTRLDDSYEPDFHYMGKCREVSVRDDYDRLRLRVDITFDLYPFKIDNHDESADLFDPFNFDLDAFQNGLVFELKQINLFGEVEGAQAEAQRIRLYNASQKTHHPTVKVSSGTVTIEINGIEHVFIEGEEKYPHFRLKPGMNDILIKFVSDEDVTVALDWRKERI